MEKKTIGGFIAALRKAGGMTQKELAERLNVSDKTVSRWERDEGVPDLSLVPVIAEIFGVTCDELLRGRRRSPEDRTAEGDAPTARGEKERQRLLAAGLSGYKSRTLVAAGLSLAGMLAAMALNFGFNRAWLGFVAGCLFYLAGTVCQAVFVNQAFLSVADSGLPAPETGAFRRKVIAAAEGVWCLAAVLVGASLPLVVYSWDAYAGLSRESWLLQGTVWGLAALVLAALVCWLINGSLAARGVYLPRENAARNRSLQKRCVLALAALVAVTASGQWAFHQFAGGEALAEWTVFTHEDSFRAFMEQDVDALASSLTDSVAAPAPDSSVTYLDENGSVISEEQALSREMADSSGKVLFTYLWRNRSVRSVRCLSDTEEGPHFAALTWDAYYAGQAKARLVDAAFWAFYALEAAAAALIYWKKRQKA